MKELPVVYNERHPNFDLLQKDVLGTLGVGVTTISERDEISRMEMLENLLDKHGIDYRHI